MVEQRAIPYNDMKHRYILKLDYFFMIDPIDQVDGIAYENKHSPTVSLTQLPTNLRLVNPRILHSRLSSVPRPALSQARPDLYGYR